MVGLQSLEELIHWEKRIQTRVIKAGIWSQYMFATLLGEGASGKVFLASKKQAIDTKQEHQEEEAKEELPENELNQANVAIKVLKKE